MLRENTSLTTLDLSWNEIYSALPARGGGGGGGDDDEGGGVDGRQDTLGVTMLRVGPGEYCPPRHPTHLNPRFLN